MSDKEFKKSLKTTLEASFTLTCFYTRHTRQSSREKVGKFRFANRLIDIVPLLSDVWLDESENQMKKQ